MNLSEATWTDVRETTPEIALVPVGSTEQHGPHAPLGTDATAAAAVAEAADDRLDETDPTAVVAPPVHVGVSEEHRAFDGTLWVSPETFRAYVRETVESLASHGVSRTVLVNGHGGNVEALAETARRLSRSETGPYTVAFTWFEAVGEHASDMGHAGPLETALLRHVAPGLVREDRVETAAADAADGWGEWVRGVNLAHDSHEFTDNGVVGDPREGDADRGGELLSTASEALVDVVRAVCERDRSESADP
ncbi:creatininase family protein [Halobaculum sp. MBLA0143]|uniref:creatininase family protein n=1 Tax=Halobaculum sp. MBLA0143 TaxID=3079933 RepID=UPI003524BCA3